MLMLLLSIYIPSSCGFQCLQILDLSGLQATSFRIGQISGGLPNGAWAVSDWVPILVKSSIHMNAIPSAHGVRKACIHDPIIY